MGDSVIYTQPCTHPRELTTPVAPYVPTAAPQTVDGEYGPGRLSALQDTARRQGYAIVAFHPPLKGEAYLYTDGTINSGRNAEYSAPPRLVLEKIPAPKVFTPAQIYAGYDAARVERAVYDANMKVIDFRPPQTGELFLTVSLTVEVKGDLFNQTEPRFILTSGMLDVLSGMWE